MAEIAVPDERGLTDIDLLSDALRQSRLDQQRRPAARL